MAEPILTRSKAGDVTTLTLNQPETLNALSFEMLRALKDILQELAQEQSCRVIILRGAGKVFCAGHDLRQMQAARQEADGGAARLSELFDLCAEVMQLLPAQPQPVIAQVHGIATAAGCQLVASCDLAIAAQGTRFGANGVNIGLFCSTPMVALTRNLPRKAAFELLTTGEFLEAHRARELGLVNRVVEPDTLEAATMELAKTLAAKLNPALRIGKRTFYDQIEMPLPEAYAHAGRVMVENMLWPQTEEGINAFLQKRKPDWA